MKIVINTLATTPNETKILIDYAMHRINIQRFCRQTSSRKHYKREPRDSGSAGLLFAERERQRGHGAAPLELVCAINTV